MSNSLSDALSEQYATAYAQNKNDQEQKQLAKQYEIQQRGNNPASDIAKKYNDCGINVHSKQVVKMINERTGEVRYIVQ